MLDNPDSWRVVGPRNGGYGDRCGLVAHRGVLHPDEYLDKARLVPAVERRLGFTLDELRLVYRQGRKSAAQRALRARVDSRLLRLRDAGGNMELLAQVIGVERKTIGRALTRARSGAGLAQKDGRSAQRCKEVTPVPGLTRRGEKARLRT
jgi:hypothetical protein